MAHQVFCILLFYFIISTHYALFENDIYKTKVLKQPHAMPVLKFVFILSYAVKSQSIMSMIDNHLAMTKTWQWHDAMQSVYEMGRWSCLKCIKGAFPQSTEFILAYEEHPSRSNQCYFLKDVVGEWFVLYSCGK